MRRSLRFTGFLVALLLAASSASAHQSSTTYSQAWIDPSGEVNYSLHISTRDLYEALGLDKDREATRHEIEAGKERLIRYVLDRLRISAGDKTCPMEARGIRMVEQADRKVELQLLARCPKPLTRLVLDYQLFFDLDPRHAGMLVASFRETAVKRDLKKGLSRFEWDLSADEAPASMGLIEYVESGIEHIYTGYDHIAFVIALLLVSALRPRAGGAAWEPRGAGAGISYVVRVVTAFTVAHSITLIAAALDWIQLPSRFVESVIAASIVYVAAENILRENPGQRWPLAFAFGLIHGMGFASMLRPILPPTGLIMPLLAFNVGVELGQLSIVAVLFPVLHWLASANVERYRRVVVLGGSAMVGLFGSAWLAERALSVSIFEKILRIAG
ncbi:MAG: HupE/UreJ family protein [Deltaproteobacteria bacterium]|nr:HupE/UreJ family protein [Deltaproteobacteria bacterium]